MKKFIIPFALTAFLLTGCSEPVAAQTCDSKESIKVVKKYYSDSMIKKFGAEYNKRMNYDFVDIIVELEEPADGFTKCSGIMNISLDKSAEVRQIWTSYSIRKSKETGEYSVHVRLTNAL